MGIHINARDWGGIGHALIEEHNFLWNDIFLFRYDVVRIVV
jgi:hypothetical protein